MTDKRIILLIGRTGNGKSTIANVISDKSELKEGEFGVSETKDIQPVDFEYDGDEYRIIDTIGIGDTELSLRDVLYKLAKMSNLVKNGLSQVLFVSSGKFTEEERSTYNLLRKFIFDDEIVKYTTIVRTRFPNFKKVAKCKEDIQKMIDNGGELAEVIRSCRGRIIHVDNPPIDLEEEDDEVRVNLGKRERSRTILLTHLAKCDEVYRPENLDTLNERIDNYMTKEEELKKQLDEVNEALRKTQEDNDKKFKEFENEQSKKYEEMKVKNSEDLKALKEEADRKIKEAEKQNQSMEQIKLLIEQIRQDKKDAEDRLVREKREYEDRIRQDKKDFEDRLRQEKKENDEKWQSIVNSLSSQSSSQNKSDNSELEEVKKIAKGLKDQIKVLQTQTTKETVVHFKEREQTTGQKLGSAFGELTEKVLESKVLPWNWFRKK